MALTEIERKVLKSVRQALVSFRVSYICHGIQVAKVRGVKAYELDAAKRKLRCYVMRRLGDHATLGSWLAARNYERWMPDYLMRKARIAWIDWMLDKDFKLDDTTRREFGIYLNPERALHSYDSSGHKVQ